jgi:VWFA-related protein
MKLIAAALALLILVQDPPATKIQDPGTIKVDVHLQQVVATVRDNNGRIVKGMRAEDFTIEDGGVRQTIVHFADDPGAPLSLGILIDLSGSMGAMPGGTVSGVAAATGITRVLLHQLKPDDEIELMTFASSFSVRQRFIKNHTRLEDALVGLRAGGSMSVLDALGPALQQVKTSTYQKRALIVITDAYFGGDLQQAARAVRGAEVPIFAFAVRGVDFGLQYPPLQACSYACHQFETLPPRMGGFGLPNLTVALLDTLAKESGGRAQIFEIHPQNTMQRITGEIEEIAAELRGQYLLGYYPTASGPSNNRVVRVHAVNPKYQVYTRREEMR